MATKPPRRTTRTKAVKAATDTVPKRPSSKTDDTIVHPAELEAMLEESAAQLAPGDVKTLLAQERALRRRIDVSEDRTGGRFHKQLNLAVDCLRDHASGRIPQIPYRTIALLAAAVFYFADENDIVPDFLPRIGTLDDAMVAAIAFDLAAPGVQRYCDAQDRRATDVLPGRKK